jgi:hypothetical protein
MTNIIIDADKAIELLKAAVKLKGASYIDVGTDPDGDGECRYYAVTLSEVREDGDEDHLGYEGKVASPVIGEDGRAEPGCIVGHVYYALGLDPAHIQTGLVFDTLLHSTADRSGIVANAHSLAGEIPGGLLTKDGDTVTITAGAQAVMSAAQAQQDCGQNWGQALIGAEREMNYL